MKRAFWGLLILVIMLPTFSFAEANIATYTLNDFSYDIPADWVEDKVTEENQRVYSSGNHFVLAMRSTQDFNCENKEAAELYLEKFVNLLDAAPIHDVTTHDGFFGGSTHYIQEVNSEKIFSHIFIAVRKNIVFTIIYNSYNTLSESEQAAIFSQIQGSVRLVSDGSSSSSQIAPDYEKEILFQDIPWDINVVELKKTLVAKNAMPERTNYTDEDYIFTMNTGPSTREIVSDGLGASISIYSVPKDYNIAGHKLDRIRAYCYYEFNESVVHRISESSHFYLIELQFDVTDTESAFMDIKEKLNTLYGLGKETSKSNFYFSTGGNFDRYESWIVWEGLNNTGISLHRTYDVLKSDESVDDDVITLSYGKLNSEEIIANLIEANRLQKVSIEQGEMDKNKDNFGGL